MVLYLLIGGLGLFTGFLSGMLGIGGGIIMAPLLLYVPPCFGYAPFTMHVVVGLTIVQGVIACLSGALVHRKFHFVSWQLTAWMGTTIFLSALIGGAAAGWLKNSALLFLFAILALFASLLIFYPTRADSEDPDLKLLTFSRTRAVFVSGTVGLLGGMVGQGGSFLLIPLMTSFLQIPTRIAIGSNMGIVLLSSLACLLGKAITGQINWILAIPIALTVFPAARLGGLFSRRVPVAGLRLILAVCIAVAALRMGISAFTG